MAKMFRPLLCGTGLAALGYIAVERKKKKLELCLIPESTTTSHNSFQWKLPQIPVLFRSANTSNGDLSIGNGEDLSLHTHAIDKSMIYKYKSNTDTLAGESEKRPLVIMLAWMNAKDRHLKKYQQLYIDRGYDILTVWTSPAASLIPEMGSHKIAERLLAFLSDHSEHGAAKYSQVVVHAFSIGIYQFGEVLVKLAADKEKRERDRQIQEANKEIISTDYESIEKKIKGIIFDSPVDLPRVPPAFAYANVPNSETAQKVVTVLMRWYLKLAELVVGSNHPYKAVRKVIVEHPLRTPMLVIISDGDPYINKELMTNLVDQWTSRGIQADLHLFAESPHVTHYKYYPTEYEEMLDKFLNSVIN